MRTTDAAIQQDQVGNLYNDLPSGLPDELVQTLFHRGGVRIERIVSGGHVTPADEWSDQGADEWVVVLNGRAVVKFEDRPDPVELGVGDHIFIAAHRRHRVEWTVPNQPTIWLAVHAQS